MLEKQKYLRKNLIVGEIEMLEKKRNVGKK